MIKGKSYKGVAIERWTSEHRQEVFMWLVENFGEHGDRWAEDYDYDFINLIVEDDVYVWYKLKWS
jgi:hypothetical protein